MIRVISAYLAKLVGSDLADTYVKAGEKIYELRYGENPHQRAAFYRDMLPVGGLADAEQLNGKELSYNNIIDTQAAWDLVREFKKPACVIIKHNNPCGTALGSKPGGRPMNGLLRLTRCLLTGVSWPLTVGLTGRLPRKRPPCSWRSSSPRTSDDAALEIPEEEKPTCAYCAWQSIPFSLAG